MVPTHKSCGCPLNTYCMHGGPDEFSYDLNPILPYKGSIEGLEDMIKEIEKSEVKPEVKTLAEKIFAIRVEYDTLKEELFEKSIKILGLDWDAPASWPIEDITTDWYDNSICFEGVENGFKITTEQQGRLKELGFSLIWVCYKNDERDVY